MDMIASAFGSSPPVTRLAVWRRDHNDKLKQRLTSIDPRANANAAWDFFIVRARVFHATRDGPE